MNSSCKRRVKGQQPLCAPARKEGSTWKDRVVRHQDPTVQRPQTECTKIAHRRSLAIFAADSGIAGNSAVGVKFVPFIAIFFAEEIAHLGALKIARFCGGAVKIAAATAENRAILVHSAPKFTCGVGLEHVMETQCQITTLIGACLVFESRALKAPNHLQLRSLDSKARTAWEKRPRLLI